MANMPLIAGGPRHRPVSPERVSFHIGAGGAVADDGCGGLLGESVRYVVRMAAGAGLYNALGELRGLTTYGPLTLTASVDAGGTSVIVVEDNHTPSPTPAREMLPDALPNVVLHEHLTAAVGRMGASWGGALTGGRRLVACGGDPVAPEVVIRTGLRMLAVLDAFEAPFREYGVMMRFSRGRLFALGVGGHVAYFCLPPGDDDCVRVVASELLGHVSADVFALSQEVWRPMRPEPIPLRKMAAAMPPAATEPSAPKPRLVWPRRSRD